MSTAMSTTDDAEEMVSTRSAAQSIGISADRFRSLAAELRLTRWQSRADRRRSGWSHADVDRVRAAVRGWQADTGDVATGA